jgi:hypothetical protein
MAVLTRGIQLTWTCSHYVYGRHDGVRVRIDAVAAQNMPLKVFAYRMLPRDPASGQDTGYFSHICSPPDLVDYPEDGPVTTRRPEWFRLAYVDVLLRSVAEAQDFVAGVYEDVRRLKATLDIMDALVTGGTEIIGTIEEESSEMEEESSSEVL